MDSQSSQSKQAQGEEHKVNTQDESLKFSLNAGAMDFVPGSVPADAEAVLNRPKVVVEKVFVEGTQLATGNVEGVLDLPAYAIQDAIFQGTYSKLNYLVNDQIHCFDYQKSSWTTFTEISHDPKVTFRKYSQAIFTANNNTFYVIGGLSKQQLKGKRKTLKVRIGQDFGKRIEELSYDKKLIQGRYLHTCVLLGDKIYAMGGQSNPKTYLNTVEVLDQEGWKSAPSMNIPRSNFTSFVYQNAIYVAGGFSGQKELSHHIERYEVGSDSWQMIELTTPMYAGMTVIPRMKDYDTVWLIGGFNGESSTKRVVEFNSKTYEVAETGKDLLFPVSMGVTCWYGSYNYYVFSGGIEVIGQVFDKGEWKKYEVIPQISHIEAASFPAFRK